jgi:nitrogen fixation NifU-like protein
MDSQHHHVAESQGGEPCAAFLHHANQPCHLGELNTSDGQAKGVGSCGDSLTVYLKIENNTIDTIAYRPEGCVYTIACGSAMSTLANGRTIESALELEPEDVGTELGGLPEDHMHCARLAVNTLGEAIADYLHRCQRDNRCVRCRNLGNM